MDVASAAGGKGRAAHPELCREGSTASWHVAHGAQVSGSPYYLFLVLNSSSKNNDFGPLGKPFKNYLFLFLNKTVILHSPDFFLFRLKFPSVLFLTSDFSV